MSPRNASVWGHLRRSLRIIVPLLAVALFLAGCGDSGDRNGTPPEDGRTGTGQEARDPRTIQFEGSGDDVTDGFEVGENWEIAWTSDGDSYQVELLTSEDESRGTIVESDEGGEGSTFVSESGEFRLRVTTQGDWTIEIIDRSG